MAKKLTDDTIRTLAFQIIEGTEYLHSKKIIHHALTPGNIAVNWRDQLRICNFGSAINVKEEVQGRDYMDIQSTWPTAMETKPSALRYSAPECTMREQVSPMFI